jgi:hypothetical protein
VARPPQDSIFLTKVRATDPVLLPFLLKYTLNLNPFGTRVASSSSISVLSTPKNFPMPVQKKRTELTLLCVEQSADLIESAAGRPQ